MRVTHAQSAVEIRAGRNLPWQGSFRRPFRSIPSSSGAPRLLKSQRTVSRHKQIRQCRHNEQAIAVLHHAAIADFGKAEDSLDDKKGMLDLGTYTLLSTVLLLFLPAESLVANPLPVGEVARLGCCLDDHLLWARVCGVAIHPTFVAVQQLRDGVFIMHVGRRGSHRVDQLGHAIHADVRLHAEVPLVALLGLAHLRVASLVLILDRGWCMIVASQQWCQSTLSSLRFADDGPLPRTGACPVRALPAGGETCTRWFCSAPPLVPDRYRRIHAWTGNRGGLLPPQDRKD